jgi:hypothetical protein
MLLSGYFNLNKLDKDVDVNEKGYANITIGINEKTDEYGNNASIWMNQTKEQREAGEPRKYIGNARVVFINPNENIEVAERKEFTSNAAQNPASSAPAPKAESTSSDLPF